MSTLKPAPRPTADFTLEKSLPSNTEAERLILGCILLDPENLEQCATLKPDHFFLPSHRLIYAAMIACAKSGITPLTVQEELRRIGELDRVGGPASIASLFDGVPRFSRIESYIEMVKSKYRARRLIHTSNAAMARAFDDEDTPDAQIAQIERELAEIGDVDGKSSWRTSGQVFSQYIAEVEQRGQSDSPVVGFATGFHHLDNLTLGFERRLHTVIGARPGVGKTALALALTLYISMSKWNQDAEGRPPVIAWFSMEMPASQLIRRIVSIIAGVDSRRLHMGRLSKDEWRSVSDAESILSNLRIHFDERCGLSVPKIRQAVRTLRQQEGAVDVVITDYLQLGDGEQQKGQNREQAVAAFCGGMTQMFKEQDICGISMAQLNRNAQGEEPTLKDFRESGRIEQDASIVIGLHRPDATPESDAAYTAKLILMKQRNGPMATVEVGFLPTRAWFFEPERSTEQWQAMLNRFRA